MLLINPALWLEASDTSVQKEISQLRERYAVSDLTVGFGEQLDESGRVLTD